jgi:hypothetical protein
MRPPYYLLHYRCEAQRHREAAPGERFGLVACSVVLAGLIAVAFLSGW